VAALVKNFVILAALAASACAPAGYVYETGNFIRPHPTPELCASRGQVLDMAVEDCVTPAPRAVAQVQPPAPTPVQVEQPQGSNAAMRERNECVAAAIKKYERKAEGAVASYAIMRAELQQCDDLALSRLAAQQMRGADCSLKLDWMLRYQMRVTSPGQKAMAGDRYAEICGRR